MIHIDEEADLLTIRCDTRTLKPSVENQLAFWGFDVQAPGNIFVAAKRQNPSFLIELVAYLEQEYDEVELNELARSTIEKQARLTVGLEGSREIGSKFKGGVSDKAVIDELTALLTDGLARSLKPHQIKATLHLLLTQNAANFSVPGSGKTSVVLAAYEVLRKAGEIDALFVVGPPACFGPWRDEYEAVLGKKPSRCILSGGDIDSRRSQYRVNRESVSDLFLTSFQTLQHDWEYVKTLFQHQGIRFFLVVDEAHYIKQLGGVWANAILQIAPYASRRCVLTGTPFPKDFTDGFNLFDVLWPGSSAIPSETRYRIVACMKRGDFEGAIDLMELTVGPLFYRVRKSDLGLAPQNLQLPPIQVEMNTYERLAYDSILGQIRDLTKEDYFLNLDLLTKLRKGRIMRLRQALSFTALLSSAISEYDENLLQGDLSLTDLIMQYDKLEVPGKITAVTRLGQTLVGNGEKVVIWSNFVRTLYKIHSSISELGIQARIIYGGTPVEKLELSDEQTRENIIREFLDPNSGVSVLVANPAACAESISLHKQCSNAIYYDLSYNCAQYLQSLDRIHRVGGSEDKPANYYFLQYANTMENDILSNVLNKARNMSQIIDRDYPIYSLDMFAEDDELEAYDRIFR